MKFKELFKPGFNTVFIPLFAALGIFVLGWYENYNPELFHFEDRAIGIATLKKVDVTQRIGNFYRSVFLLLLCFTLLLGFSRWLWEKFKNIRPEIRLINILSVTGVFLLVHYLLNQDVLPSVFLVISLIIYLLVMAVLKRLLSGNEYPPLPEFYLWPMLLSVSILSSVNLLLELRGWFYPALILFNLAFSIPFFSGEFSQENRLSRCAGGLQYLLLLPLTFVLAQEITLILNQRGHSGVSPYVIIFLFGIIIILLVLWSLFIRKKQVHMAFHDILKRNYLPLFLISYTSLVFYTPVGIRTTELFEIANEANPISDFFLFGQVPVVDFLNTHLLSDLAPGFLYTLLNGYENSLSFRSYDFILLVISVIIYFYFIRMLLGDAYLALVLTLFFPFLFVALYDITGAMLLLVPLVLVRLYNNPKPFLNYFLFGLVLVLEAAWRPDSGFPALVALVLGLIGIAIVKGKEFIYKYLLVALSICLLPVVLFIGLYDWFVNPDAWENVKQALEFYSSSPQARGYAFIAYNHDRYFRLQHLVMPVFSVLFLLLLMLNNKSFRIRQTRLWIGTILLIFFYLLNFQRGIIRHGFVEQNDVALNSFLFFIIGLPVYFIAFKNRILRHIAFASILSIAIIFFKMKEPVQLSNLITEYRHSSLYQKGILFPSEKISRHTEKIPEPVNHFHELEQFMNANLSEGETFFDFSNSPALYFHLEREQPVYFVHLVAITTENLQGKAVEQLRQKQVPYVVFRRDPLSWYDNTDDILNTLRFYKISEYLYRNYEPYIKADQFFVWKRKRLEPKKDNKQFSRIGPSSEEVAMMNLPYIWANYDRQASGTAKTHPLLPDREENTYKIPVPKDLNKERGNYLDLEIANRSSDMGSCILTMGRDSLQSSIHFNVLARDRIENYRVRISVLHRWYDPGPDSLEIHLDKDKYKLISARLLEAE